MLNTAYDVPSGGPQASARNARKPVVEQWSQRRCRGDVATAYSSFKLLDELLARRCTRDVLRVQKVLLSAGTFIPCS